MNKLLRKITTIATAAVMGVGACSLAACAVPFTAPSGIPEGEVVSNGGFVVEKGEYLYFINGVETYTSDNTYGAPLKGALMRVKKSEMGEDKAEVVVPSLMVAADYTSGIFIYGDRVYYATPTNVKNTSGVVENSWLDFKSAKLDGTDLCDLFRVEDNATVYRFVSVGDTVYTIYVDDTSIHSYNTETKTDTELARNVGDYVLSSSDKTDPYIYYTMSVTADIDIEGGAVRRDYNQIYRVCADATEAPYDYEWRQDYLDEHDGEAPYLNLGEIVLDGIGQFDGTAPSDPTRFTHDLKDGVVPIPMAGYSYSLESYANGGIYFTRSELIGTQSINEDEWLYFLDAENIGKDGFNSITGNGKTYLDTIAKNTDKAGTAAVFFRDGRKHSYIYVNSGNMFRADVVPGSDGNATELLIARNVSGASLMYLDVDSDPVYDYVYFNMSGSSGLTVQRAVINGTEDDYKSLNPSSDSDAYKPVRVLNVEHARSWYPYEVIGGIVYFADAETFSSSSYSYLSAVDLNKKDGSLLNNAEIKALNELYEEITDSTDGYLAELDEDHADLSDAIRYYFYTGETKAFEENLKESADAGQKEDALYTLEDQEAFRTFADGTSDDAKRFVDADGNSYRTRSYFVTKLGRWTEADKTAYEEYWSGQLKSYTPPTEENTGLPAWAWALIAIGIAIIVIAVVLIVVIAVMRKRNKEEAPAEKKMYVDTTDNRDIDVYADEPEASEEEKPEE